jgi:5-methylcytosine-specific restriction protein A
MTPTDRPMNDGEVLLAVKDRLQAMSLLRLRLVSVSHQGWSYAALRPADDGGQSNSSFSIILNRTPSTVEALVVPDLFAGEFVRRLGRLALEEPSRISHAVGSARDRGVTVGIRVNDLPFRPNSLGVSSWRTIEIECRSRLVKRRDHDHVVSRWVDVGATCLALVLETDVVEQVSDFVQGEPEGAVVTHLVERFERSPLNRLQSILHHGYRCWICEFSFADVYGPIGELFTEVHHIFPLSEMSQVTTVDPHTEMVPLCANCHRMVHRASPPLHPIDLRSQMGLSEKTPNLAMKPRVASPDLQNIDRS